MQQSTFVFTCVIGQEAEGYSAICLDVDVATQGDSIDEVKRNIREAVHLYVESAIESNLPILRPVPEGEAPTKNDSLDIVETFKLKINIHVEANV